MGGCYSLLWFSCRARVRPCRARRAGADGADKVHPAEQGVRQRLVHHHREQGGHALERQVLVPTRSLAPGSLLKLQPVPRTVCSITIYTMQEGSRGVADCVAQHDTAELGATGMCTSCCGTSLRLSLTSRPPTRPPRQRSGYPSWTARPPRCTAAAPSASLCTSSRCGQKTGAPLAARKELFDVGPDYCLFNSCQLRLNNATARAHVTPGLLMPST